MTSRRRSNRIVLQEVLEESRREAEEALKSQPQPQPNEPDHNEDDDDDGSAGGRRGVSGSGRGSGDDVPSREKGRKRLRKLNDATAKKKTNVSKNARTNNGANGDDDDDEDDVVVLSDGVGDPDLDDSDDGGTSGGAGAKISRKTARGSSKGVVRNSNRRKRRSIHDDDDEDSQGANGVNDASDADDDPADRKRSQPSTTVNSKSSTSVSIPKKAIPRRKPDSSEPSSSSLLAHMTPALPSAEPPFPQGLTRQSSSYKFKAPPGSTPSLPATAKTFQDASQGSNIPSSHTTSGQRLTPPRDPPMETTALDITKRYVPPRPPPSSKVTAGLPKQKVMDDLERLCDALAHDSRLALPPASSLNLSGSFLGDDDRYDFFDTNQFGEIVFQPKVPIFPEEFPPGMAQHTLSWWGVLDPALGDGKFTAPPVARAPDPGPHPPAPSHNGGAGPGYPGLPSHPPSSQLSSFPALARSGEPPQRTESQVPGMNPHGRGPRSWTPPRQPGGGAGRGGGGGGSMSQPSNPRRYSPPRNYDRNYDRR